MHRHRRSDFEGFSGLNDASVRQRGIWRKPGSEKVCTPWGGEAHTKYPPLSSSNSLVTATVAQRSVGDNDDNVDSVRPHFSLIVLALTFGY